MNLGHVIALAFVAITSHVAPWWIADALGHQELAWETILKGAGTVVLWLFVIDVAVRTRSVQIGVAGSVVGGYGVAMSIQRPVCRAFHPLDKIVQLPKGEFLCDATGLDLHHWAAIVATLVVAAVVIAMRSSNG